MRLSKLLTFVLITLCAITVYGQQSRVDSLQIELQKRISRISELQNLAENDSVVAEKTDELNSLLSDVESAVSDLNLVFDGSELSIMGSGGSFSISLPEDFDETLSSQISLITEQILAEMPDSLAVEQGLKEIRQGLHSLGLVDGDKENIEIIEEIVVVDHDVVVEVNERVVGDVVVISGGLIVYGVVEGEVVVLDGSIVLEDNSVVQGDIIAILSDTEISPDSSVGGSVISLGPDIIPGGFISWLTGSTSRVISLIVWFVASTGTILLIFALFPRKRLDGIYSYMLESTGASFGFGILWLLFGNIGLIILIALLAMTIIAIPLALLLILVYMLATAVVFGTVARWVGAILANKIGAPNPSLSLSILLGCLAIEFPSFLVVVLPDTAGSALSLLYLTVLTVVYCVGSGALLGSKIGSNG
ncbi:MAG: hypothetical protein GY752_10165 [bacterium]|nr:hypothetical protein [bacterium]MCP4799335.1 hypothetical protein [bacterium]